MTSTYGHFCLGARALDTVGDRWSLLIVRDLLPGPRRFSELQRLLTNVTAKWLTIRLRQLEEAGIVTRDATPGKREVWYALTEKGRDLEPVLETLLVWGFKHERHALEPDEAAHPDHVIAGMAVVLNDIVGFRPPGRRTWRFAFGDAGTVDLAYDGERWAHAQNGASADVVVRTTPRAWATFITTPPVRRRLPTRDIALEGDAGRVAELSATLTAR
jgi:DNA-binding HxlR family transcriptional regulator